MITPYPVIYQKPFHCAIACLAMIIYHRFGVLIDQEEVGRNLGVRIPAGNQSIFRHDLPIRTRRGHDEGISTIDSLDQITSLLHTYDSGISVSALIFDESQSDVFWDQIDESLARGDDIWMERALPCEQGGGYFFHDQLLFSREGRYYALDPDPSKANIVSLSRSDIAQSMDGRYSRMTGILIVSDKKISS